MDNPLGKVFLAETQTELVNLLNHVTHDSDVSICLAELVHLLHLGAGSFYCKIYSKEDKNSLLNKTCLTPDRLEKALRRLSTSGNRKSSVVLEDSLEELRQALKYKRSGWRGLCLFQADMSKFEQALLSLIYACVPKHSVKKNVKHIFVCIEAEQKRLYIRGGELRGTAEILRKEVAAHTCASNPVFEHGEIEELLGFVIAEQCLHGDWHPKEDTNIYPIVHAYLLRRYCDKNMPIDFLAADYSWYMVVKNIGILEYRQDRKVSMLRDEYDKHCIALYRKLKKNDISYTQYCRLYLSWFGQKVRHKPHMTNTVGFAIHPSVVQEVLSLL